MPSQCCPHRNGIETPIQRLLYPTARPSNAHALDATFARNKRNTTQNGTVRVLSPQEGKPHTPFMEPIPTEIWNQTTTGAGRSAPAQFSLTKDLIMIQGSQMPNNTASRCRTSSSNYCNVPMICVDSATSAASTCRELGTSSEATANDRASPVRRHRARRRYHDPGRSCCDSLARRRARSRAGPLFRDRFWPLDDDRTARRIHRDKQSTPIIANDAERESATRGVAPRGSAQPGVADRPRRGRRGRSFSFVTKDSTP
jgi:hypothetical protein